LLLSGAAAVGQKRTKIHRQKTISGDSFGSRFKNLLYLSTQNFSFYDFPEVLTLTVSAFVALLVHFNNKNQSTFPILIGHYFIAKKIKNKMKCGLGEQQKKYFE
jgi:hypothetical protein